MAVPGPGKASNQALSKLDQGRASSRDNGSYLHPLRKLSVFDVGSCGHFPVNIPHSHRGDKLNVEYVQSHINSKWLSICRNIFKLDNNFTQIIHEK